MKKLLKRHKCKQKMNLKKLLVIFEVQTTTFWIMTMTLKLLAVLSLFVLAKVDGSQYNNAASDHFQADEAVFSKLENLQSSIPIDEISQSNFRLKRTANSVGYRSERPSQTACRIYREAAPTNLKFARIDGVPVPPGEYPYMGALMYPKIGGDDFDTLCGCFLISERYVLTTAHCVKDLPNQPAFVRFGVVLWNSTDKVMPPIDFEIENVRLHPEYVSGMIYNDIALIRLRKDVEFNYLVRPGCLYSDTKDIDPETRLVAIGWGANYNGRRSDRLRNEALQMTNISTVPLQVCNETYKDLGFQESSTNGLYKGHYCTTEADIGNGRCLTGHAGSPVQFMQNEEWIIVGIVSFGVLSCNHKGPPDVNTRVAHYLDWIESIAWKCPSCLEHSKRPSEGGIDENTKRPSQEACRRFNEAAPLNLIFPKMDGIPVSPGEYPHIGALMRPTTDDTLDIRCSCALISERYALTTAQCAVNRSGEPTFLRFGVVVWNSMDKNLPPLDVEIETIIIHPKYVSSSRYHDIALIRLRKDVAVNLFVRPACLYSDTKDVDPETRLISISWGWNVTSDGQTRIRNEALQMVNVSTVPLQDCNATVMELGPNRSYRNGLNEGHYCTSDPILEKKHCFISSAGSPVELVENQKSTIVGLDSFGVSKCSSVPTVNTRVAHYLDWIEDIVWPCTSYQKKFVETVKTRPDSDRPSQIACKKYRDFKPTDVTHRIVGDSLPVKPGEFPHMGAMLYPQGGGGGDYDNRCGSSLISERYVLTAAHCVNDQLALPSIIRFGVVVWNSVNDDIIPVDVEIEEVILHPCYKSHLRYHDVALIRLVKEIEFSFFVRPACLYSNTEDVDPETRLAVIGWGVTDIQSRKRSGILLKTNVTTFPLQDCNVTHINWGTSRSYRPGLNEGHYCASDPGLKNDACQADSGGPMQLVENKESTIVGIVSFGNSCGSSVPSVYARVAHYLDWIESIVWPSAAPAAS